MLPVYCLMSGLSHVCEFNINHFLINTSFLRTLPLFFRFRKHFRSISGLFGGARFRKFGPGFIGDSEREVDQCQNGIGTGDRFARMSVFL